MLKKIFINIIIFIMILSVNTYAIETEVSSSSSEKNEQTENITTEENTQQNTTIETLSTNTSLSSTSEIKTNTTNNTKSSEARLKELKVDIDGLTPKFDKDVTKYYLNINSDKTQVNVTATTIDSKAKATVSGNKDIKKGNSTITISVKAENGTTKKYYIYITKGGTEEKTSVALKELKVTEYKIFPEFRANIYTYNLNVKDDVSKIEVIANPETENAKVEILGNEKLQKGENTVRINVISPDGTNTKTYKINTYVLSENIEIQEESKQPAIILIAILGTFIILLGIFMAIKRKMN